VMAGLMQVVPVNWWASRGVAGLDGLIHLAGAHLRWLKELG
jgi:hypothetical protein